MFLDNLLDDREAEAGAAHAGRHIGLGQRSRSSGRPMPVSVISITSRSSSRLIPSSMRSPSAWASPRSFRLDRFHRILDDIGQCPAKLAAVADQPDVGAGRVDAEVDARVRDLMEEQGGAGNVMDILLAEHRLGHAREVGEFVDHSAEVADLPDDRVGQPPERFRVGYDFGPVAPLEPLGGQLIRVSGFLISWAMRRAMSDQAARRWSLSWSVMSSKVSTKPSP